MENNDYRNITLSTKVCARQKAEYVKLATENGISVSEWVACTVESNKNKYGKEGDPTKRELALEKEIDTMKKKNIRLEKDRESADYRVSLDMKRADKAVEERDEIRYQLKENIAKSTDLELQLKKYKPNNQQYNKETNSVAPLFSFIGIIASAFFLMRK
jgi:predicted RNase H-like nuclease (RuvC/YqgF family)